MTTSPGRKASAALLLATAAAPGTARAHLTQSGVGPVYDGILHFFSGIHDLVPVIALALLAGLSGVRPARWATLGLPIAWLAGALLGDAMGGAIPSELVAGLGMLVIGGLAAAGWPQAAGTLAALSAALGFTQGLLNAADLRLTGGEGLALFGMTAAATASLLMLSALAVTAARRGTTIALRVGGSWIAATGLLLAGWSFSA